MNVGFKLDLARVTDSFVTGRQLKSGSTLNSNVLYIYNLLFLKSATFFICSHPGLTTKKDSSPEAGCPSLRLTEASARRVSSDLFQPH